MKNKIKLLIKNLIQKIVKIIYRGKIFTKHPFTIFESNSRHTFFGYYDVSPFNLENNKILALSFNGENRSYSESEKIDIGFFDIDKPKQFNKIAETKTWCWQQGCRLKWFPCEKSNLIVYNTIVNQQYGSVLQNIDSQEIINEFSFPIYDLDKEGKYALSLNFSRLQRLRPGYGYNNFEDMTKDDLNPIDDGIWICDLNNNSKKMIISIDSLKSLEHEGSMIGSEHYINHLCFNPSGKLFMFFHLWVKDNKRNNRAIIANTTGEIISVIQGTDFVSHYTWSNNNELLIFSSRNKIPRYYLYNVSSEEVSIIGEQQMFKDGHPTFISNKKEIVTDTYPSRFSRYQSLFLYSLKTQTKKNIGKIYSPENYQGEVRCDLHPRISPDEKMVAIDGPFKDGRKIIVFNFKNLK